MGHPRKARKTYSTPLHPWQKDRIIEEKELLREYGLKNKKELWKNQALLKKATSQVKKIIAAKNPEQAEKEKKQLIDKLIKYGLIKKDTKFEEILDLNKKDFLERRLQTIILKTKIANTVKQARQFIIHGHVKIKDKKITVPSYLVSLAEESQIAIDPLSTIAKKQEEIKKKEKEVKVKIQKESKAKEVKTEEKKEEVKK